MQINPDKEKDITNRKYNYQNTLEDWISESGVDL